MIRETCSCGATFHTDESFTAFAERAAAAFRANHQHEAPTTCPAHGPLDDKGGCAGCVADDRAEHQEREERR